MLHPSHLPDLNAYLDQVRQAIPGISCEDTSWTAIGGERRYTQGLLRHDEWQWQLIFGIGQMPETIAATVQGGGTADVQAAIHRHQMFAVVYLTSTPEPVNPVQPVQRLAQVVWPWLSMGADALLWPDAGTGWPASELRQLQPTAIGPDELYLFIGNELLGGDENGHIWFRTRGLHQFMLPDVACMLAESHAHSEEAMAAVDTLLASVPPYLLELGRPLPEGEQITLESCVWRVVPAGSVGALPFTSEHGAQVFELISGP